jgi:hypothetical protein
VNGETHMVLTSGASPNRTPHAAAVAISTQLRSLGPPPQSLLCVFLI